MIAVRRVDGAGKRGSLDGPYLCLVCEREDFHKKSKAKVKGNRTLRGRVKWISLISNGSLSICGHKCLHHHVM